MFTFVLPLLSWAGMGFAGFQYGTGTNFAPPLLTSQVSSSATKCWCQTRNPWSWIMRDMSIPAARCSATGLFVGLLMNWSSSVRNCVSRALLRVETSLRFAIGRSSLLVFCLTTSLFADLSRGIEMLLLFAFPFAKQAVAAMVHVLFLLALPLGILPYLTL